MIRTGPLPAPSLSAAAAVVTTPAAATARFRQQVRAALTRELQQNLPSGEARLREIFERFDSSGDGRLVVRVVS